MSNDILTTIAHVGSAVIGALSAISAVLLERYLSKRRDQKTRNNTLENDVRDDTTIHFLLGDAMAAVECDRISLYQFHNGDHFLGTANSFKKVSNTHEVCAPGISSEIERLQSVPITVYTHTLMRLINDGHLFVEDSYKVDDAHEETMNGGLLKSRGIHSVYKVPVLSLDGKVMAFMSAQWTRSTTKFSKKDLRILQETAAKVSGHLYRMGRRR